MEKKLTMMYSVRQTKPHHPLAIDVLSLLYQPIISTTAQALYLHLWSESQQMTHKVHCHHDLSKALNIDETHLNKAFSKLEGMGLIQSFYKQTTDNGVFLYELHPPVTAQSFFSDMLLTFALCDCIGEEAVNELKQYFNIIPTTPTDYKEVTVPFQEVYYISEQHYQQTNITVEPLKKEESHSATKEENKWFDQWMTQIDDHLVDPSSLIQYKMHIINAKRLYHFSDEYLCDLLYASIDLQTGQFIANKWLSLCLKAGKKGSPSVQSKEVTKETYNEANTKEEKIFQVAMELSPMRFLQSIKEQKKGIVTSQEQFLLKELVEQHQFSLSYINLVTYFLLVVQNYHELPRSLYEKIVNRLSEKQCATCQELWSLLPVVYKELTSSSQKGVKQKKVIRPEWEEKKLDNHQKEPASKVTLTALDEQLKAIRQMGENNE